MRAGLLNEVVSFFRRETDRDNLGGMSERWVKVFDKRASVRFKSGVRKEANGEIFNSNVNIITIRICKEVDTKMQLKYNGQLYRIESINHARKAQSTVIEAEVIND